MEILPHFLCQFGRCVWSCEHSTQKQNPLSISSPSKTQSNLTKYSEVLHLSMCHGSFPGVVETTVKDSDLEAKSVGVQTSLCQFLREWSWGATQPPCASVSSWWNWETMCSCLQGLLGYGKMMHIKDFPKHLAQTKVCSKWSLMSLSCTITSLPKLMDTEGLFLEL